MKVLLVGEDGAVHRRIVAALKETPDVDLAVCPSADLPSRMRPHSHPHLVILDVHAQSGKALDLIQELKSMNDPPIVMALSSATSLTYRALCHKAGAEYYFDIVHEPEWLSQALRELREHLAC